MLRCSASAYALSALRLLLMLHPRATATTRRPLTPVQLGSYVWLASRETCLRLPHIAANFISELCMILGLGYAWPGHKASVKKVRKMTRKLRSDLDEEGMTLAKQTFLAIIDRDKLRERKSNKAIVYHDRR